MSNKDTQSDSSSRRASLSRSPVSLITIPSLTSSAVSSSQSEFSITSTPSEVLTTSTENQFSTTWAGFEVPSSTSQSSSVRTTRSGRAGLGSSGSQGSRGSRSSSARSSSSTESITRTEMLIVDEIDQVMGSKLPSRGQVIGYFKFLRRTNPNMKSKQITGQVYDEIARFYNNAKIPVKLNKIENKKICDLYKLYQDIKDTTHRKRELFPGEKAKLESFIEKLDDLFDISTDDALDRIEDESTKQFMLDQRKPKRPGFMKNIDSTLVDQISLPTKVIESEEILTDDVFTSAGDVGGGSSSSSSEDTVNVEDANDPDYVQPIPVSERHKHRIRFINEEMTTAMDAIKVSSKAAMRLIIPTMKALKHDPDDYVVSVTTISKARNVLRGEEFLRIQEDFIEYVTQCKKPVQIHWDGKSLENIVSRKREEYVVVKAVCGDREQILNCCTSGKKGIDVAETVFKEIQTWQLEEYVASFCFDTTNVNSGKMKGAAVILERLLSKSIQYFPCRHHIFEVILRCVYEFHMGATKADKWDLIDQNGYVAGTVDRKVAADLKPQFLVEIKNFILEKMENKVFRSDYREFLELALLFIGEKLPKKDGQVIFHPPGADHHARWMSKGIYSLKIFMFREQYMLTDDELKGLRKVCVFLVKNYLKAWFTCPLAVAAPFHDFEFTKSILLEKTIEKDLVDKIIKKIRNHLWYLTEESIGLAFFDSSIPLEKMEAMVSRLRMDEVEDDDDDEDEDDVPPQNEHKLIVKTEEIKKTYLTKKFSDFVSKNTLIFFERFQIPTDFLREPVQNWSTLQSYQEALAIAKKIKVTNDTAERSVQLMSDFANILTRKETGLQEVVSIVAEYRKTYPTTLKKDLMK